MPEQNSRERDILLAWNEFAYVQDMTKGDVNMYVGPTKISLSNTERLVRTDPASGRVIPVIRDEHTEGVQPFIRASLSQYVVVRNPAKNSAANYNRGPNSAIELQMGKAVVLPGPVMSPLWPGQTASVVDGHRLKEDEYLLVRVCDVIQSPVQEQSGAVDKKEPDKILPIGTEFIVRGSETSFYMPTTGLEVVAAQAGSHVRKAVKLTNDEYCILQNANGEQKYVRGPKVVIPEPDETFIGATDTARVLKAHKLVPEKGLHLIVTRDFELTREDNTKSLLPEGKYNIGQEIFLAGKEGLFFPTESVEIIGEVSPVSIAENEGLYVRDKRTGKITTVKGPNNYLPDPTKNEVVTRNLDERLEALYRVKNRDKQKAISVYVAPNHAIMVVSGDQRRVVKGPGTQILEHSETLEQLALSTGTPKTDAKLLDTVFLQIEGNKVSDLVTVETKDHVALDVKVSYRLSFRGEDKKWFDVNNYVGLLCDHLSSIVRSAVKSTTLETFYSNSTELIRNSILGEKSSDGKRTGRIFAENGMQVYDLEVLSVDVRDRNVAELLAKAQQTAFTLTIRKREEETKFELSKAIEDINQKTNDLKAASLDSELKLISKQRAAETERAVTQIEVDKLKKVGIAQNTVAAQELEYNLRKKEVDETHQRKLQVLEAETDAVKQQMTAISPDYVAALTRIGDQSAVVEAAKHIGQLSVLEGKSVQEIVERALKGLPFVGALRDNGSSMKNGS